MITHNKAGTRWYPLVITCFIIPINSRYKLHKPQILDLLAANQQRNWGTILYPPTIQRGLRCFLAKSALWTIQNHSESSTLNHFKSHGLAMDETNHSMMVNQYLNHGLAFTIEPIKSNFSTIKHDLILHHSQQSQSILNHQPLACISHA